MKCSISPRRPDALDGPALDRFFTGQQTVIANVIIDFPQREYEPLSGRWFTPDPAGLAAVDPNNPQTWNRYAYVGGNPLGAVDPLGLDRVCIDDGLGTIHCVDYGSPGAGGNGSGAGAGNGGCGGNGPGALAVFGGRYTAAADCGGGGGGSSGGPRSGQGGTAEGTNSWLSNVVATAKSLSSRVALWYCGANAPSRILRSMEISAAVGAGIGGVAGFTTGEIFGGEVSLGATGLPGAALGATLGGIVGAMNGSATGVESAAVCAALGYYH